MLDFGNYKEEKKNTTGFTPIPNGFYEATITKAKEIEGTDKKGNHYEYINVSLQIRNDVEQLCKNRYVSGKIQADSFDKDGNMIPADKRESLSHYVGRNILNVINVEPTKKDMEDWLYFCEYLVGKKVRIKVTNKTNGKTWTDSNGVVHPDDPYLSFYESKVGASTPVVIKSTNKTSGFEAKVPPASEEDEEADLPF